MRGIGALLLAAAFLLVAALSGFRFYESLGLAGEALDGLACEGTNVSFLVDPTKLVLEYRLRAYYESPRGTYTVDALYRVTTLEACLGLMVGYTDIVELTGDRELLAALSGFVPLSSRPTSFLPSSYVYVYPQGYLSQDVFSESVHVGSYGVRPALVVSESLETGQGRLSSRLAMDRDMGVLLYRDIVFEATGEEAFLEANVSLERVYVNVDGDYADLSLLSLYTLASGMASGLALVLAAYNARAAL
nr:hypothetical protein [Desulfurococcales archaeon]